METRRIYVDMVADLFHAGHVNFLRQIKLANPDCLLYVGLMTDEEADRYKRPTILNLEERRLVVEACRYVDRVFTDAPMPITADFIDRHDINLVIHGDDISDESRKYWYREPLKRGIYREIPYTQSISTSDIIARIRARCR